MEPVIWGFGGFELGWHAIGTEIHSLALWVIIGGIVGAMLRDYPKAHFDPEKCVRT